MDGNGNVWLPVIGIPKHDTYPRLQKAYLILRIDLFTFVSPLVSKPVTWRDFALLHTHGLNCRLTLLNNIGFDNNLIRYL